jgi:hypothetical protein
MGKDQKINPLTLYRVTVSKAKFNSIPEPERLLFIRFGHLIDEINTLLRIFLWSVPSQTLQEEEMNGRLAQNMVIARVLTGKLYEAYGLIKKHYIGERIAEIYDPLLDDIARDAYLHLKRYFSKPNLIKIVRNKYAFHYSHDELKKLLRLIPLEDNLIFYFSEDSRNNFLCSADVIINHAMLESIESGRSDKAQRRLEEDTVKITKWLRQFITCYIYAVMKKHLGNSFKEMGAQEITIQQPAKDTEIELPYFLSFEENR